MEMIRKGRATVSPAAPYMDQRGGQGDGRKKTLPSEIHIKPTFNGGFTVSHRFDNSGAGESYIPPKEHAFESHGAMMAHVHVATGGKKSEAPDPDVDEEKGEEVGGAAKESEEEKPEKGVHGRGAPSKRSFGAGGD